MGLRQSCRDCAGSGCAPSPSQCYYSLGTFVRSKKLASSFRCSFMSLCVFVFGFFFLPTVFVSCSFIKRSHFIPRCSCFQVREHRSVTDFHGSQPEETLHIPTSLCTLKDTSHLHLLKIFHGIVISVDICVYLLSCFGHSKLLERCNPQGTANAPAV